MASMPVVELSLRLDKTGFDAFIEAIELLNAAIAKEPERADLRVVKDKLNEAAFAFGVFDKHGKRL